MMAVCRGRELSGAMTHWLDNCRRRRHHRRRGHGARGHPATASKDIRGLTSVFTLVEKKYRWNLRILIVCCPQSGIVITGPTHDYLPYEIILIVKVFSFCIALFVREWAADEESKDEFELEHESRQCRPGWALTYLGTVGTYWAGTCSAKLSGAYKTSEFGFNS